MIVGERVKERMEAAGLSQAELARRVGMAQPSIFQLIKRGKKGSTKLHLIARELGTTPAYLSGETDDPHADAPPPPLLDSEERELFDHFNHLAPADRKALPDPEVYERPHEFYDQVITTHSQQARMETLIRVRDAGMKICCGGIVGMGESRTERAGLLAQLEVGTLLAVGAAGHGGGLVRRCQPAQRGERRAQVLHQQGVGLVHLQRRSGVENVLGGGAPVNEASRRLAAKRFKLVQHWHKWVLGKFDVARQAGGVE